MIPTEREFWATPFEVVPCFETSVVLFSLFLLTKFHLYDIIPTYQGERGVLAMASLKQIAPR